MNATTKYTGERNGYRLTVYEYTNHGQKRYGCRVTNLKTGNSEQLPGYSSYSIALEIAQDTADAAGI